MQGYTRQKFALKCEQYAYKVWADYGIRNVQQQNRKTSETEVR